MKPLATIAPVFYTTHFVIIFIITVVTTMGINAVIDYFLYRDNTEHYLLDGLNTLLATTAFNMIVGLILFFTSGAVHKRIRSGVATAVSAGAYRDNFLLRIVFFSLSVTHWKSRLPLFLTNVALFPGLPTFCFIIFFCWCSMDFRPLQSQNCPANIAAYVIWTEVWKGVNVGIVAAMNYAAAHHEDQPELKDALVDPESIR